MKQNLLLSSLLLILIFGQGCCSFFIGTKPAPLTSNEKDKLISIFKDNDFPKLVIGIEQETLPPKNMVGKVYYSGLDAYDGRPFIKLLDTGLFKEVNFIDALVNKPDLIITKAGKPLMELTTTKMLTGTLAVCSLGILPYYGVANEGYYFNLVDPENKKEINLRFNLERPRITGWIGALLIWFPQWDYLCMCGDFFMAKENDLRFIIFLNSKKEEIKQLLGKDKVEKIQERSLKDYKLQQDRIKYGVRKHLK